MVVARQEGLAMLENLINMVYEDCFWDDGGWEILLLVYSPRNSRQELCVQSHRLFAMEVMPLHMLELMPVDSIGAALVDHEVVVMPANLELITMVGIFNCLTILIILFSCRIVLGELMPMHMLKVV
jgi:hypothetical protein